MSEAENLPRKAGEHFSVAANFSFEDAQARRFRYHLLRLTVVGLTEEDVKDLGELGRLAFLESDVTAQATKIKQRASASPLAFAIADIMQHAGSEFPGRASLKAVMFGTVLGAYASLGRISDIDESAVAIVGAIAGAVGTVTSTFIADIINRLSWAEYLNMEESN